MLQAEINDGCCSQQRVNSKVAPTFILPHASTTCGPQTFFWATNITALQGLHGLGHYVLGVGSIGLGSAWWRLSQYCNTNSADQKEHAMIAWNYGNSRRKLPDVLSHGLHAC